MGRLPGWIAQWKEMIANGEPIGSQDRFMSGSKSVLIKYYTKVIQLYNSSSSLELFF